MDSDGRLFGGESRFCNWCHRPLAKDSEVDLCPACQESMQFREIREYVRKHDVNEFQLAEVFGIPLRRVKGWIREGRLEYKELEQTMKNLYCEKCGKAIQFGSLCPECNRALYGVQGGFETLKVANDADEQIRFYNRPEKNRNR